jgi:uncharacterized protein YukE
VYQQLLANGWTGTHAAAAFGARHTTAMTNADDLEQALGTLSVNVDQAKIDFFAADHALAGEFGV